MSLLGRVAAALREAGIPFATVGAVALAARGVVRSTLDIDLLSTDVRCLDPKVWEAVESGGASAEVRRGDVEDPLAGVVRIRQKGERPVDVVVGRASWQGEAVRSAEPLVVLDVSVPVVRSIDLVLLKLFAGGLQDAWDIRQLLMADADGTLRGEVELAIGKLPKDAVELWKRIRADKAGP